MPSEPTPTRVFLGGDADAAWNLLSTRCRDRLARSDFATAVGQARNIYGGASMTSLEVDTLEGTIARVTYRYDDPSLDQEREPWVLEDGQWRQDDC